MLSTYRQKASYVPAVVEQVDSRQQLHTSTAHADESTGRP